MPSHLAGRVAIMIGVAAILLFVVVTLVPTTVQLLVALLSLPLAATAFAGTATTSRRRAR